MFVPCFGLTLIIACVGGQIPHDLPVVQDDLLRLLSVVNDHTVDCEARAAAEGLLIENSTRLDVLPHVFRMLPHPISDPSFGGPHKFSIVEAYVGHPGTGSAESDCAFLPVRAQIAYARMRLWKAYAQNAQPAEERKRVYAALFDEMTDEFQVRKLIDESRRNWTPEVRRRLLAIYEDPQWRPHTRRSVAHTIYDMHHATPRAEHVRLREELTAVAWSERGTEFSRLVAETLGRDGHHDPRVAVLRINLYEHEAAGAWHQLQIRNAADLIDRYFGNVTGLYIDSRSDEAHRRFIERRDREFALQEQARETGDDTKLRAFEAELAAKQQAEIEERLKRIDAWIAANRDRLEQEAADLAREREKERHDEREPQPRQRSRGD